MFSIDTKSNRPRHRLPDAVRAAVRGRRRRRARVDAAGRCSTGARPPAGLPSRPSRRRRARGARRTTKATRLTRRRPRIATSTRARLHGHARRHRHGRRQHRRLPAPPLLRAARRARERHAGHGLRRSRRPEPRRAESRAPSRPVRAERPVRARVRRRRLRAAVRRAVRRQENGRRGDAAAAIPRRAVALAARMGERPHRGLGTRSGVRRDRRSPCSGISSRCRRRCIVPGEIANGNTARGRRAAVPADRPRARGVGDSRVAAAASASRSRRSTLQRVPVALGGRLKGTIRVEAEVPVTADFAPRARVRRDASRAAAARTATPKRSCCGRSSGACRAISARSARVHDDSRRRRRAGRATGDDRWTTAIDKITWRLEVDRRVPRPRFLEPLRAARVRRPPKRRQPSETAAPAPRCPTSGPTIATLARSASTTSARRKAPKRGRSAAASTKASRSRSARSPRSGPIASVVLFMTDAPAPDPDRVLVVRRVVRLVGAVAVVHGVPRDARPRPADARTPRLHGARARSRFREQWIRAVRAKRGMQAGNKLYYDLKVETDDGTHTAASSLADYDVASWLARHWMARRPRALRRNASDPATSAAAKPAWRSRHESQRPQARPCASA